MNKKESGLAKPEIHANLVVPGDVGSRIRVSYETTLVYAPFIVENQISISTHCR